MDESTVDTLQGRLRVHSTRRRGDVATLLLHGAAGSWTTWRDLVEAAGDAPDLVIPDLPGWGGSDADPASLDAAALADAAAAAARSLGYAAWHVVGHSLGGFVALELAVREPEATRSVTMISGTTFGGRADRLSTWAFARSYAPLVLLQGGMRVLAALGASGVRLVRLLDGLHLLAPLTAPLFARSVPDAVRDIARDVRPAAFVRAVACARRYPAAERWSRIRCPVLDVHGEHDVFASPGDDERLAGIIPGLTTLIVPATGHFAHVEHPALIARLMLSTRRRTTRSEGTARVDA